MGNKTSQRHAHIVMNRPSPPDLSLTDIKVSPERKLVKVKDKCKSLSGKKKVSTAKKISIIKEAVPGLKIIYEPLKTYYSIDKVIMPGKFGAISKAYCKQDLDTEVLVKVINLDKVTSHLYLVIQELVLFGKAKHPNICKIKNILCDNDKLYLVMDYNGAISLSDFVIDQEKLNEDDALNIITQLLKVLDYLNSMNFCHRDFKPENILINPDTLEIKLLNFEFSSSYQEMKLMRTKLGNQYYMAPEVLTRKYDQRCDIWSIGCIAYYLQTGFPPFLADTIAEVNYNITHCKLNFLDEDWENRSPESLAFIRKALTIDPKYRLTIKSALFHPWVTHDSEKMVDANPQDLGLEMDSNDFDLFLRETFSILLENFDTDMLESLKNSMVGENKPIVISVVVHDILTIVENTDIYDDSIRELLKNGLKHFNTHVDCREFLESVIEEKKYIESQYKDDCQLFEISEDTATRSDDTGSDSFSPVKKRVSD